MSNHTPWSQEDAENEVFNRIVYGKRLSPHQQEIWLDALAWAAEMIEAAPTVYGETTIVQYGREVPTGNWTETRIDTYDTHSAKLVGVRPIEGSEK